MNLQSGKFKITRADGGDTATIIQDGLVIGRLQSCDVILNHPTVSRIHAGINRVGNQYFLINLSVSNSLTLNGRLLQAEQVDVLADGDIIQLGPFAIVISKCEDSLDLFVTHQFTGDVAHSTRRLPAIADIIPKEADAVVSDVLKVFWEKRTREKEEFGTILRPVGKPVPGKEQINWKPTKDLTSSWRGGLFSWSLIIIALLSFAAIYLYPQVFAPEELSSPHVRSTFAGTKAGLIANRTNANACATCHQWNQPIENSCIQCHSADAFHATNTPEHQAAGITCMSCHSEHKGASYEPRIAALDSCAICHNDNNKQLYNGKSVFTPHKNEAGYPTDGDEWKYTGLKPEIAQLSPGVTAFRDEADTEKTMRVKEFHAIHISRLIPPEGMKTDSSGVMSCSSCHKSFAPIDRETPKQTCAACHNGYVDSRTRRVLINADRPNCVSCHVQHYYDKNRWSEYLAPETAERRVSETDAQIKKLGGKTNAQ